MPRVKRALSKTGIYHIMLRGINQQNIFAEDRDNEKFIDILDEYQKEIAFEIYAYCLMGNHVHLLMKEGNEEIGNTMRMGRGDRYRVPFFQGGESCATRHINWGESGTGSDSHLHKIGNMGERFFCVEMSLLLSKKGGSAGLL